ncbi:MAG TPA: hypothetical protein DEF82_10730 [Crocinitomicaceae bacterium]|nr:hypothetical protein [Flavobacteriales bacterium]HBW87182.1 hypothetical protein [Crocinitomicaceae bacterium]
MFKSKLFILISTGFLFFSCEENNNDPQFCECLSISKSLNEKNKTLIESPAKREVILEELKKLVSEKRKICSPYEQMTGQELIDKENYCKN